MSARLGGMYARTMEPDALTRALEAPDAQPGKLFTRFFEVGRFQAARKGTAQQGELDAAAACALSDCVVQHGMNAGWLDVREDEADEFPERFVELAGAALGDEVAAQQLYDGGVMGRLGHGRHFFGSLPVRIVARQFTAERKARARTLLHGGWDEDLLNTLESAGARSEQYPDELLIFVPTWLLTAAPDDEQDDEAPAPHGFAPLHRRAPAIDLLPLLKEAIASRASDLVLVAGQRPTLRGPFGARFSGQVLTPRDVSRTALAPLSEAQRAGFERTGLLVTAFDVEELGRFRLTVTMENGAVAASIRALGLPPELAGLGLPARLVEAVQGLERGLCVIAGPPGAGRSTTLAAVLRHQSARGRAWTSLEQPIAFPLGHGEGVARQVELGTDQELATFREASRLLPVETVAVDLVDDAAAVDVALDAAADGRLALCVVRGLDAAAVVHRLAVLDARWSRRRLAERLTAVLCQRLVPDADGQVRVAAELLRPTEALRRHLRSQETMPPPALLELEGEKP